MTRRTPFSLPVITVKVGGNESFVMGLKMLRLVNLHEMSDFHEDFHIGCFFSFFPLKGKHVCHQKYFNHILQSCSKL
jgi:hypothetical protein